MVQYFYTQRNMPLYYKYSPGSHAIDIPVTEKHRLTAVYLSKVPVFYPAH